MPRSDARDVVEKDVTPQTTDIHDRPIGLAWPPGVFSLSHVAVPFPMNDPLYGTTPDLGEDYGIRLGRLDPRGERGVLLMSVDDLMRLSSNPFFPLSRRARARVGRAVSATRDVTCRSRAPLTSDVRWMAHLVGLPGRT